MRILVIGAGGVGSAVAPIAARRSFFEQHGHRRLRPGAGRARRSRAVADPRFVAARVDASQPDAVAALCREHRITHVLNAVDPRFVMPIFDGAFAAGADYLDMAMSLSPPASRAAVRADRREARRRPVRQGRAWESAGRLALVGMGVEPGLSDVFARYAADHLFSEIDELGVRDGANLVVAGYDFAPSFSHLDDDRGVPQPAGHLGGGPRLVHDAAVQRARDVRLPRGHRAGRVRQRRARGSPAHAALGQGQAGDVQVRPGRRVHQRAQGAPHSSASTGPTRSGSAGVEVSPRDVVAACLPDPADARRPDDRQDLRRDVGHRHGQGRHAARGLPVPRRRQRDVDGDYGSQAVVWQTAINPVVALELLAAGTWTGAGVLGPEAFDAVPFLDLLDGLRLAVGDGGPDAGGGLALSRTGAGSAPTQASSSRFGASQRAAVSRSRPLRRGVVLELVPADPARARSSAASGSPEVEPADRRGGQHRHRFGERDRRSAPRPRAARRASPSRCGRGRPGSPAPAGCPGSARRSGRRSTAPRRARSPTARAGRARGAARRRPRRAGRRAPSPGSRCSRRGRPRTSGAAASTPMPAVTAKAPT